MSTETYEVIAKQFTELIDFCFATHFEQSLTFKILMTCFKLAKGSNILWDIEYGGSFFLRYKDHIKNKNISFFIDEHDYMDQHRDWMEITHGYGSTIADSFIKNIKATVKKMYEKDPEMLEKITSNLLSLYCKYLKIRRAQYKAGEYDPRLKGSIYYSRDVLNDSSFTRASSST